MTNNSFYTFGIYDEAVNYDENDTKKLCKVRRLLVSYVPRYGGVVEDHTFILENSTTLKVIYTPPKELFDAQFRSRLTM